MCSLVHHSADVCGQSAVCKVLEVRLGAASDPRDLSLPQITTLMDPYSLRQTLRRGGASENPTGWEGGWSLCGC